MSSTIKDILANSRPPGSRGRGDKYLADIAKGLQRLLLKQQELYAHPTCRLDKDSMGELAAVLVEFAEDVHAEIGLWSGLERMQQQFFGTPLPFLVEPSEALPDLASFDQRRVQFLIWTLLPCFVENLVINPTHTDLQQMAEAAARYLAERFAPVPKDSGVKQFLSASNTFGWDIKRKLLWLGSSSYLFRLYFQRYLEAHVEKPNDRIPATDDFICQECTEWSGLGVIDVLAAALDLPEEGRATLRTWHERHNSYYRVESLQKSGDIEETLTARNVVSGGTYIIRTNMDRSPFQTGMLIQGALTPWRGEWYWSGHQQSFGMAAADLEPRIRQDMLRQSSNIAYRYCLPELEIVRQQARDHHTAFIVHYGDALVAFSSGLALAAAEQKRMQALWAKATPEQTASAMKKGNLSKPQPDMPYPPDFLEHEEGIGAFSDPVEGVDYLLAFDHVISGLRKKGAGLNEAEVRAILDAVQSDVICPAFIRRLAAEHGTESIAAAFCIRDQPGALTLEVLLRRYKGAHYRRRFPAISLVV